MKMDWGQLFLITRKRISRGPGHVAAAVAVMGLSFLVVTVFSFIFVQSHLALSYFASRPQVTAFLKDSASPEQVAELRSELEGTGLTSAVRYVSKDQAYEIYKQQNSNNPALLELVTPEFLPASIEVQTKDLKDLPKIAEILNGKKSTVVEEVVYYADVVANLSKFTQGLGNTALFLLVSLILTLTITSAFITGLQTYVYREEIEIMRLIGATRAFVYTPFVLEAIFYGVISSVLGSLLALSLIPFVLSWFSDLFRGISSVQISPLIYVGIIGASLVIGILTNLAGSYLAVRRYARV
jgi:cell division transport system permease protein